MSSPGGAHLLEVVAAVLTYRRPAELRCALTEVHSQAAALGVAAGQSCTASVLVVDNDPQCSAGSVVSEFPAASVRYVAEPVPGITAARNRALEEASHADLLVFLDDDEVPAPGWLAALVRTWLATRAAAVAGPVRSRFAGGLDPWIAAGGFFERPRYATGTEVKVAGAGNLLLDLHQVRELDLHFDPRLGLTGGEDTLFTKTLARRGARLVWCDEAVADDIVPAERMTRTWVLKRAWRGGLSATRTDLYLADGRFERLGMRSQATWRGLARILGGAVRCGIGTVTGSLQLQAGGLRTLHRGRGMLAGTRGVRYEEYARS